MPCKITISKLKVMHYFSFFLLITGVFASPILYSQSSAVKKQVISNFAAPIDIPMILSGNYGEIRSTHFHAGIDIKTQQVEGKNVLAADSGYIFRIAVHTDGYGHALYMRHSNGKVSVYGHLSRFEPALEKYTKEQQYRRKSFDVDLYPEAGLFVFGKGSFLGYTGNTGSSGGPHLHFEIRDNSASVPLNPLNYGFAIQDNRSPAISWLAVYPLDPTGTVNGMNQKLVLPVNRKNDKFFLSADTLNVSGRIGIGIETYDYLDQAPNECSPYTLSLSLDNRQIFLCRIDSIPFSAAGYVNGHIDYEEKIRSGRKIQKLFIEPNNLLKIYKVAVNRGIIQLKDTAVHKVSLTVRDTYGNESTLHFNLRFVPDLYAIPVNVTDTTVVARFYYDSLNVYETRDARIVIPQKALFNNINFQFGQQYNDSVRFSPVYLVHNEYTPLFKPYILSLRPENLSESLYSKTLIASRGREGKWESVGGEYKNGFVTTRVRFFGQFIVTVDSVAPEILPVSFIAGNRYTKGQVISFNITDSLSGIRKYTGYIDKKWVLFEYDAKIGLLHYTVDDERLEHNKNHSIEIYVNDNKDNEGRFRSNFFF